MLGYFKKSTHKKVAIHINHFISHINLIDRLLTQGCPIIQKIAH